VENLDDKKILDGFIGVLLPWNSTYSSHEQWCSFYNHANIGWSCVKLTSCCEYREIPDLRVPISLGLRISLGADQKPIIFVNGGKQRLPSKRNLKALTAHFLVARKAEADKLSKRCDR